jgi:hypothetical protein
MIEYLKSQLQKDIPDFYLIRSSQGSSIPVIDALRNLYDKLRIHYNPISAEDGLSSLDISEEMAILINCSKQDAPQYLQTKTKTITHLYSRESKEMINKIIKSLTPLNLNQSEKTKPKGFNTNKTYSGTYFNSTSAEIDTSAENLPEPLLKVKEILDNLKKQLEQEMPAYKLICGTQGSGIPPIQALEQIYSILKNHYNSDKQNFGIAITELKLSPQITVLINYANQEVPHYIQTDTETMTYTYSNKSKIIMREAMRYLITINTNQIKKIPEDMLNPQGNSFAL